MLVNETFRPTADDGVEVSLRFQQDSERYRMPVHRNQRFEQVSMTATDSDVHGTLAVGVLMGKPSAGLDQLAHHGD